MPPLIAPSILSADFTEIGGAINLIESSGADMVHLDVMDGSFVPPITFGGQMVAAIRKITSLPLDVHLMINEPEQHIETFAQAGADYITIHAEATVHLHRALSSIAKRGVKVGVSIVPSSSADSLAEVIDLVDLVLVMSVNPGYGGQKMIANAPTKISRLREMRNEKNLSFVIAVDGGVNKNTAGVLRQAGADILVAGSAFFSSDNPKDEVDALRGR